MNNLKAKLKKQGGFTLIEMLIVVAIIAILIAVSIPLVNSSLERAREATDGANERAFKAELLLSYTLGEFESAAGGAATAFVPGTVYKYDAANGVLIAHDATTTAYGKSTSAMGVDNVIRDGAYLYGTVTTAGQLQMTWSTATSMATYAADLALVAPTLVAG